ncbi:MAG: nucleotidyltransferase domain-containing protein [Deltaproteobacteria bacterium]|nr:nucleotidyltransferase domain-containing protein [Deltaproteobacteria bacterium]
MEDGLDRVDRNAVEEFMRRVRTVFGGRLRQALLFGSKARGTGSADSDIDVFLVVEDAKTDDEDRVVDIAFEVNLAFDVYISPRVTDSAAMSDPVRRSTPFMKAVAHDGVPV